MKSILKDNLLWLFIIDLFFVVYLVHYLNDRFVELPVDKNLLNMPFFGSNDYNMVLNMIWLNILWLFLNYIYHYVRNIYTLHIRLLYLYSLFINICMLFLLLHICHSDCSDLEYFVVNGNLFCGYLNKIFPNIITNKPYYPSLLLCLSWLCMLILCLRLTKFAKAPIET